MQNHAFFLTIAGFGPYGFCIIYFARMGFKGYVYPGFTERFDRKRKNVIRIFPEIQILLSDSALLSK